MSTLELEHLKHTSSSSNNLSVHSDGSLTLGMLQGNVGIGTSSPSQKLHVESAGANYITTRDSTSGGIAGLICQNGSDTRGIRINNANLELYDFSASAARMTMNANGVIQMPSQPAFHVRLNDTGAQVQTPHTTHTVWENQGGHWNSTSHRFVAPVGGFYYFILSGYTNYAQGHGYIGVRKNGTQIQNGWHWNYASTGSFHGMGGMTAGLTLNTNDYVDFTRPSAGASSYFAILNASGFLIG